MVGRDRCVDSESLEVAAVVFVGGCSGEREKGDKKKRV